MSYKVSDLIHFGYDKDPAIHARGWALPDWSLVALEDSRGFGWKIKDRHGNRSPVHMSESDAIARLLESYR